MKTLKNLPLLVVLGSLLASIVVFTPTVDAQTLYALLLIDDGNPSNFQQHQTSQQKMENLLKGIKDTLGIAVEQSVLTTTAARGSPDYPTFANIKKWIDAVNVDRNDVVFIYSSSYGGLNRQTRELYLGFSGVRVERVERPPIAEAVRALPCRLKLLVTDPCSYGVEIFMPPTHYGDYPNGYRHLFLEHEGFLNVTAATEGEYAGGDDSGGWFTQAFVAIMGNASLYDTDRDGFVSWKEIFVATQKRTEKIFSVGKDDLHDYWKRRLEEAGQQSQRPKYFGELPQRISN